MERRCCGIAHKGLRKRLLGSLTNTEPCHAEQGGDRARRQPPEPVPVAFRRLERVAPPRLTSHAQAGKLPGAPCSCIEHGIEHGGVGKPAHLGNGGGAQDKRPAADAAQRHEKVEQARMVVEHARAEHHIHYSHSLERPLADDIAEHELHPRALARTPILELGGGAEHVHATTRTAPARSAANACSPCAPHLQPMSANERSGANRATYLGRSL
jgi:hypothetical protein